MNEPPSAGQLESACRRLLALYDVDGWWPARGRFEVMVGAVLVQNTRWPNVAMAIRSLRQAGVLNPRAISSLRPEDVSDLIRPAGCQSVKARRLKALAAWVDAVGNLRKLQAVATDRLRGELLEVHGIGYETADAILCFAFGRPQFIADKYARTWLRRMGCVPTPVLDDYEACRRHVQAVLIPDSIDLADLHAAIVQHGQTVCGSEPACALCAMRIECRHGAG